MTAKERLEFGALTLELIDKRRLTERNDRIGRAIERQILDTELDDLAAASEREWYGQRHNKKPRLLRP